MTMKKGMLVDIALFVPLSSTKSKVGKRDPKNHEGNQLYFGKNHKGVEIDAGLIPSVAVTSANVYAVVSVSELLQGDEGGVRQRIQLPGYPQRTQMFDAAVEFRVSMRLGKWRSLPDRSVGKLKNPMNTTNADIHSKIEYLAEAIKQQVGVEKTRHHKLVKKRGKINVLTALHTLFIAYHRRVAAK